MKTIKDIDNFGENEKYLHDPITSETDIFIFCGGLGTRLRPYTLDVPKPLLKINEYFPLYIICYGLKRSGFSTALVNYSYGESLFKKAQKLIKNNLDFEIRLFEEKEPMGHAGVLKAALSQIQSDTFLALNGDTLTDLDEGMLVNLIDDAYSDVPFSILAQSNSSSTPLGYDIHNNLAIVNDKEYKLAEMSGWTDSAGIYGIHKSVFDFVPDGEFFGFFGNDDLTERLVKAGKRVYINTHNSPILQYSVGTVEEYENLLKKPEIIEQFL